jgi:UDP-N-acetylglucosamine--N-acetylmuramyl-(pentapeptide) pyrophosphoryl-undecaprenol N-acetylglucosamine transferase
MEPLYRSQVWRNWRLAVRLPAVIAGTSGLFSDFDPQLVVGTGGYASAPALAWAIAFGRRAALQEQNAMPGIVTRMFSSRVRQVHLGYPEARARLRFGPRTEVYEHGNPVALEAAQRAYAWPRGRVLLVVGGSQGARVLNERLLAGLDRDLEVPSDVSVVWVAGSDHAEAVAGRVRESAFAERIRVVPFIADLGAQLAGVTLAISRAGAMTTAELAAAGVPAVLVPLPSAAGHHQVYNARALQQAGAAVMREEGVVRGDDLWNTAIELLADEARLQRMSSAMRERGRPDAASRIVAELLRLLAEPNTGGPHD